jgi:hypothetical protein
MIRTIASLALVSATTVGCAGALDQTRQPVTARGALTMEGPVTRAVLRGPAMVHVSVSTSAPLLFAAPWVHGTDEDCRAMVASRGLGGATRGGADYARLTMSVSRDEVLCVTTSRRRTDELLWHAHRGSPAAVALR